MRTERSIWLPVALVVLIAGACAGCSALFSDGVEPGVAGQTAVPGTSLVTGVGVVEDYRAAAREADAAPGKSLPLAYWVNLRTGSGDAANSSVVVYVDAAKTAYEPDLDRYLLRGRRVKYIGLPVRARGAEPAHVDTSVSGGKLELMLDPVSAARLADCVVGRRVSFEGVVEPRGPWMAKFAGQEGQNWKLIVTLPSGEILDMADPWRWGAKGFQKILQLMRAQRAVKIRVVGEVCDAAAYKSEKRAGSPRDVRGKVVVAVEELHILGDEPGSVRE